MIHRRNLALIFIPFCSVQAAKSGWPTCHDTHSFFHKKSGLVCFSARSPSIGETYQREQTSILCRGESTQDLRQYLSLSAVWKWEKHIRGHCAGAFRGSSPNPPRPSARPHRGHHSHSIWKHNWSGYLMGRKALNKIPRMLNSPAWFLRPYSFLPCPG